MILDRDFGHRISRYIKAKTKREEHTGEDPLSR